MLDSKLLPIVIQTQRAIAALGNEPKRSAIYVLKERFAEDILGIIGNAGEGISDAEKIAAFDNLLRMQQTRLREEIKGGCSDEDSEHWAYEEVVTAVFGPNIFDAINAFGTLLP